MSLLDELKAQAGQIADRQKIDNATLVRYARLVDTKMTQCLQYLAELSKHMNVVRPAVAHGIDVGLGLRLDQLHACEFFTDSRKTTLLEREHYQDVSLSFQYRSDRSLEVRRDFHQMSAFQDLLIQLGMSYEMIEHRNGAARATHAVFRIKPLLRGGILISAQHATATMTFKLHNVRRTGYFEQAFAAESVSEVMLEEMAKCILARPNTFEQHFGVSGPPEN